MVALVGSAAIAKFFPACPPGLRPAKTPLPAQVAGGAVAAVFAPSHVPACWSVCHVVPAGPLMLKRKTLVSWHARASAPAGTQGFAAPGVAIAAHTTLFAAVWWTATLKLTAALAVAWIVTASTAVHVAPTSVLLKTPAFATAA